MKSGLVSATSATREPASGPSASKPGPVRGLLAQFAIAQGGVDGPVRPV